TLILLYLYDEDGTGTWADEYQVIKLTTTNVVKGKSTIGGPLQIITANSVAPRVDWCKLSAIVLQNPHNTRARAIEREVIKFATAIIVKGKGLISSGLEIIAANSVTRVPLLIDGCKLPGIVLEDEDGASSRPVEHEMIELATAITVKGKSAVGRSYQVIAADATARIALCIDRSELAPTVLENKDGTGTWAV